MGRVMQVPGHSDKIPDFWCRSPNGILQDVMQEPGWCLACPRHRNIDSIQFPRVAMEISSWHTDVGISFKALARGNIIPIQWCDNLIQTEFQCMVMVLIEILSNFKVYIDNLVPKTDFLNSVSLWCKLLSPIPLFFFN